MTDPVPADRPKGRSVKPLRSLLPFLRPDGGTMLLALGALQHYLDLAVAHPDLASRDESQPVDARYAWFAAHALATAQTLWSVAGVDENWRRPVDSIIRQHSAYLRAGAFLCGDYRPDFVSYLRSRVPDLKCASVTDAPPCAS